MCNLSLRVCVFVHAKWGMRNWVNYLRFCYRLFSHFCRSCVSAQKLLKLKHSFYAFLSGVFFFGASRSFSPLSFSCVFWHFQVSAENTQFDVVCIDFKVSRLLLLEERLKNACPNMACCCCCCDEWEKRVLFEFSIN